MSEVVLSEKLLAGLAGWEVVKQARSIVAENRVLSSHWAAPTLRGVVQSGTTSYRAGLIIHRENDAENLCTCRQSREWGTFCPHSIAVGIHALKPAAASAATAPGTAGSGRTITPGQGASSVASRTPSSPAVSRSKDARRLRRAADSDGNRAQPLAIHVVFPPNLADGLARGKATAFFEGHWVRGQVPLSSLPLDQPFRLEPQDARLLDAIETLALGDTPAMVQVNSLDFAGLLEVLVDHPRVTFGKKHAARIRREPWRAPVRVTLEPDGAIVVQVRRLAQPPTLVAGERWWVITGTDIQPMGLPKDCLAALNGPLRLSRAQVPAFVHSTLPALMAQAEVEANFKADDFEFAPEPPRFHLELAGGIASLTARLHCRYGPRVLNLGLANAAEALWMPDPANPRRYATRDPAVEKDALDRLKRNGFTGPDAQGAFQLNGQNAVLTFFARAYPRIEKEWEVTLEERLERSTEKHLERIEPRFAITPSGEQWFDLQVTFSSRGGQELAATDVQRLLRGGQSFSRLKNGKFALIDTGAVEELEEILVDCAPQQHSGVYRMNQAQAGFLSATLDRQGWEPVAPAAWRERARQQSGEVALECPPLGHLDSVLRPYQKQGVAWLAFLRRNGFGGILADEMGLGKTLQALAHLQAATASRPSPNTRSATPGSSEDPRPHLVVCPTSLVSNWVAEAAKFTPGLRVLALQGSSRHDAFARIPESDLVVTSYALIRRDLERYGGVEFDTVILDEAQHIKNRQTRNAQAVKAIRSRHRVVLTGTPLENSVLDLWSIFDFLMPGYLGGANEFRERCEIPIARERDPAAQARLARRIRPFLLRRLKRDVAPELPARIDQVVWCELTPDQATVYEQLLNATRREVTEAVGAQGLAKSRMLVLTALLRLRQACCDLRLLDASRQTASVEPGGEEAGVADTREAEGGGAATHADASASSGKVEAFSELLEEVLDGGHRVLVFSQFTRMLGLLKERLDAAEIRYSYLDGSTRDRGEVVSTFQNSPDIPVFLISLKAGGVGLNLTAADTVIHFDPWWNPAVEEQATDRAHRIGQTRVVSSYKLITRGTVEEKILSLQDRKRELIQSQLTGEEQLTQALTWEEIGELLS